MKANKEVMNMKIADMLPLLIPIIILQFGLQIYCIIDLIKRKRVQYLPKWIWFFIVIIFSLIGVATYITSRGEDA